MTPLDYTSSNHLWWSHNTPHIDLATHWLEDNLSEWSSEQQDLIDTRGSARNKARIYE